jgi:hypothetical protein
MSSASRLTHVRHRFSTDPFFRRKAAFLALGLFSVVGWGMVIFQSPLFLIRDVRVEGAKGIDPIEAKSVLFSLADARTTWRPWHPRHRWFFPRETIEQALRDRWLAERVEARLERGSNIVRLIVHEQHTFLWVKTATQWLEVDPRGVIHRELSREELLEATQRLTGRQTLKAGQPFIVDMPIITETLTEGFRLPYATDDLAAWFRVAEYAHARPTLGILTGSHDKRTVIHRKDKLPIYIDISEPLTNQINALEQFLGYIGTRKNAAEQPTQFIDVRVPGRVYSR